MGTKDQANHSRKFPAVHRSGLRELNAGSIINSSNVRGGFPNPKVNKFHFQKLLSENPYEAVKDGSTNPGATSAVEPYVAFSKVDSKTGEDATGAETETDE